MQLKQGTLLQGGKYKIEKCLGQGSFGITYLAKMKHSISARMGVTTAWVDVAIKEFFMKDFNSRQPDGSLNETTGGTIVEKYKKDFKREADNLSKMNHPGVVDILDTFEENNTCYLVMAYIDGESLDAYISKHGAMPEKEALVCFEQIADALHYMHCQHMLHLDLKPRNIMRDSENKTFVIDFGLSKQYDDNDEPESSTTLGLGTQGYAPLEQGAPHSGHDFPVTIDVYALGATLYKMLTAQTPPHAAVLLSSPEIVKNALTANGVSKNTMSIILNAMSPRKEDRYKNVAGFMNAFGWKAKDYPQEAVMAEVVEIPIEENIDLKTNGSEKTNDKIVIQAEEVNKPEKLKINVSEQPDESRNDIAEQKRVQWANEYLRIGKRFIFCTRFRHGDFWYGRYSREDLQRKFPNIFSMQPEKLTTAFLKQNLSPQRKVPNQPLDKQMIPGDEYLSSRREFLDDIKVDALAIVFYENNRLTEDVKEEFRKYLTGRVYQRLDNVQICIWKLYKLGIQVSLKDFHFNKVPHVKNLPAAHHSSVFPTSLLEEIDKAQERIYREFYNEHHSDTNLLAYLIDRPYDYISYKLLSLYTERDLKTLLQKNSSKGIWQLIELVGCKKYCLKDHHDLFLQRFDEAFYTAFPIHKRIIYRLCMWRWEYLDMIDGPMYLIPFLIQVLYPGFVYLLCTCFHLQYPNWWQAGIAWLFGLFMIFIVHNYSDSNLARRIYIWVQLIVETFILYCLIYGMPSYISQIVSHWQFSA